MFDDEYDTVVVAIKPEPKPVVFSFKDRVITALPLLADPGSSIHEAVGIVEPYRFHNRDMYLPATLLIDKQGVLRWIYIGKKNSDRPSLDLIVEQLEKLKVE
ncbi:MAG: peroxiredoxin family protein [Proteobacteria bacterium]|nr:peroxiredoxin family protein [Pseudomonadota bacterium]